MYFKEKKYEMVLVAWEAKTKDVCQFEGTIRETQQVYTCAPKQETILGENDTI